MNERSGSVRLVEPRGDTEARGLVTTIPRKEVEEALRKDAPVDLLLDVERVAADGVGRETERIALAWEPQDLERLLGTATNEEITLSFDEAELQQLLDEDVEAHGMREKLAVLSVAAGIAAVGAGPAGAMVYAGSGGGTSVGTPAAVAPPSEISTGVTGQTPAAPAEISTGIVQEPLAAPAEVTTGIGQQPTATPVSASPGDSVWSPSPGEIAAVAAGTILAIAAAGFAVRTQRHRPAPA
ncbi:MAG TPA: hypothetical protein VIW19_00915 [Gaiellaceae bacterium]|jgi:hypothetical protein